MSPARLSIEEVSASGMSFGDMWSAQPSKKQKLHRQQEDIELVDDIETLWETRWKSACQRRRAPFQDASYLDVAPLFTALIQRGITSARSPAFTQAFLTAAQDLAANPNASSARLLNACALLRIARFASSPSSSSSSSKDAAWCPLKQHAYALQRQLHARAARMWDTDSPLEEVLIPHLHAPHEEVSLHQQQHDGSSSSSRRRGGGGGGGGGGVPLMRPKQIPALVRVPLETLIMGQACPAVVVLSNSDRMGCTEVCEAVLARGWAAVVVECLEGEEKGEEGLLCKSVLGWMAAMGFYEMGNVVVIAEGEAGLRAAESVGDRLSGVVAYLDTEVVSAAAAGEEVALFEAQPLCPSLVVSEPRSCVESNGLWTPVKDEEGESGHDSRHSDLYAFGAASTAPIGHLHAMGQSQVYAWVGDRMAGRRGGYFWTVIPAVGKKAGAMGGRFERELTPPSPEDMDAMRTLTVLSW